MGDPNCASGGCWCGGQSSTSKIAPPVVTVPAVLLEELLAAANELLHEDRCGWVRSARAFEVPRLDCDCAVGVAHSAAAAVRVALPKPTEETT